MGYARILKDLNGKSSGYRECDGEVAFMPEQQSYENIFRRVKIDIETMEVLNHDFTKDKQRVYRCGMLLRGITTDDFQVYNAVYTGNHQVIYTPYGDAKIVHPSTFEALDDGEQYEGRYRYSYGRDEEFVYFFTGSTETRHAVKLKACQNPSAFFVLSEKYAKDDTHVYVGDRLIEADAKTFSILQDGYAKDQTQLFLWGNIVAG